MAEARTVRRRRVFYIPGYDPIPPRRYRELYRTEGAAQAAISGYALTLRAGRDKASEAGGFGWDVSAKIDGVAVETRIDVLVWSDIVRGSMAEGTLATYWQLLRTAWIYVVSGAIFRLARLRKGPTIAALYPIAFLILQLLFAVGLGFVVYHGLLAAYTVVAGPQPDGIAPGLPIWIAVAAGVFAAYALLRWFKARDGRVFAYYLMHDYAFTAGSGGAYPAALEARMVAFGARIASALREGYDEVLVVGHSSGAHLAVSILADLIRAERVSGETALGFLSLGHVVPMVSFLPRAQRLRGDLRYLSGRSEVAWVDVTAPGDGCSFALCDPVAVTGVAPEGKRWPLVISAAFTQTLSPERWRELRWRFFRLHFQYLCAFDRPGDYDYFRITAGPVTLAKQYAARAPSKSRIETPMSGYRDAP